MPELPEVETMCRGIRPVIGLTIDRVVDPKCTYRPVACDPALRSIAQRLKGKQIEDVSRIGKRVIVETEQWGLVLQPKMTGLVSIEDPPGNEHIRLILELSPSPSRSRASRGIIPNRLVFWDRRGLGTIQLIQRNQLVQRLVEGKLGPDALVITPDEFRMNLSSTRRPIKVALLDQKLCAGVGNLYASEMLYASGIAPHRPASELSQDEYHRLYVEMQRILLAAIEHEGSTLSDGTYRTALNQSGNYQNAHLVYDQAGTTCQRCKQASIVRIVQAQRSTFYCPRCQR